MIQFEAWPKTPRLFRDIAITEKIDGTNSAIIIRDLGPVEIMPTTFGTDDYELQLVVNDRWYGIGAQSRNRLIKPGKSTDNYGFAQWVFDNAARLIVTLGVGRHFGEWWGAGIARRYNEPEKVFSLFNIDRYAHLEDAPAVYGRLRVVPTLYRGPYSEQAVRNAIIALRNGGSWAAPGFMNPEGVITFHSASRQVYKTLIEHDEVPKGINERTAA